MKTRVLIPPTRRVKNRVPLEECIRRVQVYGRKYRDRLLPASCFAHAIWPDAKFIATQGAGAAASRVLKAMQKRGLASWHVEHDSRGRAKAWGYHIE